MFRLLVCGGRNYEDYGRVCKEIEAICDEKGLWGPQDEHGNKLPCNLHIISGKGGHVDAGPPKKVFGADLLAIEWAICNWVPFTEYPAQWRVHGKAAGPIRNLQMLDEGKPVLVLAFPGGPGTADMVRKAYSRHVEVRRINP